MKRAIIVSLLIFLPVWGAWAYTPVPVPGSSTSSVWVETRGYSTINAAAAAAISMGKGVVLNTSITISTATTITVPLQVVKGGLFVKAGSGTLTFSTPPEAGRYQIFSGFAAGDVTGIDTAYPEWWGLGADPALAINKALNGSKVTLLAADKDYAILSPIIMPSNTALIGQGITTTITLPQDGSFGNDASKNAIYGDAQFTTGNSNIEIANMRLICIGSDGVTGGFIRFLFVDNLNIHDIYTGTDYASTVTPIYIQGGGTNSKIHHNNITNLGSDGAGGAIWIFAGFWDDSNLDTHDVEVSDNYARADSDEPVALYGGMNNIYRVSVTNNKIIRTTTGPTLGVLGFIVAGQDGQVYDCIISNNHIQGKVNVINGAFNTIFEGNDIEVLAFSGEDGFFISGTPTPYGIQVKNNKIKINAAARYAIYDVGAYTQIIGNYIIHNGNVAFHAGGSEGLIKDNYILGPSERTGMGINVQGSRLLIEGNYINQVTTGIQLGACDHIEVFNNFLYNIKASPSSYFINVATTGGVGNYLHIKGNKLVNAGTFAQYGVRFADTGTISNVIVEGNHIAGVGQYFFPVSQNDWPFTAIVKDNYIGSGAHTSTKIEHMPDRYNGSYTPALAVVSNVTGTPSAGIAQYQRTGTVMTVSGLVSAQATTATLSTSLTISLPVVSAITATSECSGVAFSPEVAGQGAAIYCDTVNNIAVMEWIAVDVAAVRKMYYTFTYIVK